MRANCSCCHVNSGQDPHIDGAELANALVSGFHRVLAQQEHLNRINVFPVADSDTGTNLSLSLSSALAVINNSQEKHLGAMLASLADALLDGARGNSGAIFAQFFQGVSDSAGELTRFTAHTFGKAVNLGSEYAHDALSKPIEGTVLSVIQAFAESVTRLAAENSEVGFAEVISKAQVKVEQALADTPKQLDVLRKAGVVDAGAKGFVDLIKGISAFLHDGEMVEMPDVSRLLSDDDMAMPVASGETYEYRYCTECIVTGDDIDRRKLRESLADLGESLVLAGSKRKAKIHIHVNNAQAVFDVGRRFGDISGEKADDLHRQQSASHKEQRNFAVITDSTADIADSDMDRLDIHMVPCRIQFGDRGYLDKVSITTEEFYERLENDPNHPTTSQPAPGDFRRQFQYLAGHFADVISVNLSSAASGTYEAARSAAGRTDAAGDIRVIDSLNASVGQGLLAVFAAECANEGLSAATTIAAVESLIPETHTYGVLGNIDYAVRGGRIPKWVKLIAASMRVTPVVRTTADGMIKLSTCLFGRRKIPERFAKYVADQVRDKGPIVIAAGHAVSPDRLAIVETTLRDTLQDIHRLSIAELGTALGVHGGPGTLMIATQPYISPSSLAE